MFESLGNLLDSYSAPPDPDLDAMRAAMLKSPDDETLLLVYADRLDELDKPQLAASYRWQASMMCASRSMYEAIIQSFGVPAHILRGEPAPSSPNEEPANG